MIQAFRGDSGVTTESSGTAETNEGHGNGKEVAAVAGLRGARFYQA